MKIIGVVLLCFFTLGCSSTKVHLYTRYLSVEETQAVVPNFLKVFANSPVALKAFLGLHTIANEGELTAKTKERIALSLAEQNACEYCVSAHTAIGKGVGLTVDEMDSKQSR